MIDQHLIEDLRCELGKTVHGKKKQLVASAAERMGVSERTLWRRLYPPDGGRKKRRRADAGARRNPDVEAYVRTLRELLARPAALGDAGRRLSCHRAIEILERNGDIPPGVLTPSAANRVARELGYTARERVQRVDSLHSNHVHVLDGSGSEYFYYVSDAGKDDALLGVRASAEKSQKNRRVHKAARNGDAPERRLVYYYGIVDMHSRLLFVDVAVVAGESLYDTVDFLDAAWRIKAGNPLAGLPEVLYTDNSTFARSGEGAEMSAALGVELLTHTPRNARAKGVIERPWRTLFQDFELPKVFHKGKTFLLSELRAALSEWLASYNAKPSTGFYARGRSREDAYRAGLAQREVRLLPADMRLAECLCSNYLRTVTNYCTVTIDRAEYRITDCPAALIGAKVRCRMDAARAVEIYDRQRGRWLETSEFKPVSFGEFSAYRDDANAEAAKAAGEMRTPVGPVFPGVALETHAGGDRPGLAAARELRRGKQRAGFSTAAAAVEYIVNEFLGGEPLPKLFSPDEIDSLREHVEGIMDDGAAIDGFGEQLRLLRAKAVNG